MYTTLRVSDDRVSMEEEESSLSRHIIYKCTTKGGGPAESKYTLIWTAQIKEQHESVVVATTMVNGVNDCTR